MKTTVKTHNKKIVVQPSLVAGFIELNLLGDFGYLTGTTLTPDQAGALIFGLEQALEAQDVAMQRVPA
jgi:hypothetical protein